MPFRGSHIAFVLGTVQCYRMKSFIAKRCASAIFDIFTSVRAPLRIIQNNTFLMIHCSLYIKWIIFEVMTSKVLQIFLLFSLYFSSLNLQISQIDQNGYNSVLRWNSSYIGCHKATGYAFYQNTWNLKYIRIPIFSRKLKRNIL